VPNIIFFFFVLDLQERDGWGLVVREWWMMGIDIRDPCAIPYPRGQQKAVSLQLCRSIGCSVSPA
jgi:hypothetical protein